MHKLIKAEKDRWTFQELYNEYIEELGEYSPELLDMTDDFGDYLPDEFAEYFNNPRKKPYIIKEGKDVAGIVVFSRPDEDDEDGCDIYIEELYVRPEYRRRGIAGRVSADYLAENGGRVCGLCCFKENTEALAFWDSFFARCGIEPEKHDAGDMWFYAAEV